MVNSHWVWYNSGKPFIPNEDKFGFVYIITNTKQQKLMWVVNNII